MVQGPNQTLRETLSRWILETDCSWVDLFPKALFTLRMTPWSHGYSLYEIVYGRPPPIIKQVSTNLPQVRGDKISQQMEQLGKVINQVTKFLQERVPFPLREQIHESVPRDLCQGLETRLIGPTLEGSIYCCSNHPTAVKVARVTPWIHHMRVKRTYQADLENAEWAMQRDPTDPQETKIILKKKKEKKIPDKPLQDEAT